MEWGPLILAFALIAAAYLYGFNLKSTNTEPNVRQVTSAESQVLQGWDQQIQEPAERVKRVAVGLNVNADLIVSATSLLDKLGIQPAVSQDHTLLNSLKDLQESFAFFFESGAAAERYFANGEVYKRIIEEADKLEQKEYSVGGNAALMAYKMAELTDDVQILLIGPIGPKVHSLMPSSVNIHETSLRDTDEVHLIMEYAKGEKWGALTTPIATRFITSHDVANAELDGLNVFSSSVKEFNPDVVMFSGLHLLDSSSQSEQQNKLSALVTELKKLPKSLPLHLELASMANEGLVQFIVAQVLSSVHSLGLNEQELGLVSRANNGPHPDITAEESGYIEIGAVADILYWILTSLVKGQSSLLTRVHFHSLTFHVVATLPNQWDNSVSAVGVGARIAGRQACGDVPIQPSKVTLRIPKAFPLSADYAPLRKTVVIVDPSNPLMTWKRGQVTFHFSPVLVCKKPGKTVGLGDAISATAMLYTQYMQRL
ncbi:ADP-dependent glucokinase-like [Patiria miniata]|uniref:ADP-dependent glucokinase n=1 Tax=Patiria miniata TaxID=46514 RepID=A0A914BKU9_PATMI|nr:ADP-dependent glucokinase-like [Patiria miniata]XP_038076903.1 ADP-dependent glucokinase-like [Patiria miniata]XP_038076904.1 ADP-dependent glucokinase-like [Patiria miniata]